MELISFYPNLKKKHQKKRENDDMKFELEFIFENNDDSKFFSLNFVKECITNGLKDMYGVLGLSKYKISVQGIDQLTKTAEIIVNFKYAQEVWNAFIFKTSKDDKSREKNFRMKIKLIETITGNIEE